MAGKPCTVCTKTVYPLEAVNVNDQTYHKLCFKCMLPLLSPPRVLNDIVNLVPFCFHFFFCLDGVHLIILCQARSATWP